MSSDIDWLRRPEMIFADIIDRAATGNITERQNYKAVVLAVDFEGGKLQNPNGSGKIAVAQRNGTQRSFRAIVGPNNPRGAIKARILTDGFDRLLDDDDVRVFWPMFPQELSGTPATPGEHVYVTFEGDGTAHGLWISRVSGHGTAGSFDGTEAYTAQSSPQSAMDEFEDNERLYRRDDNSAGLAPTRGAMTTFEDDD